MNVYSLLHGINFTVLKDSRVFGFERDVQQ